MGGTMRLFNTAANFRAMREICGVTQQQVADAMDVRVLTVKRWEKSEAAVPEDALEWMRSAAVEHTDGVRTEVGEVMASAEPGESVCLEYYRTQEQCDMAAALTGSDAGPYQFVNAVRRSAAERLVDMGYLVSFAYPDEERVEVRRR